MLNKWIVILFQISTEIHFTIYIYSITESCKLQQCAFGVVFISILLCSTFLWSISSNRFRTCGTFHNFNQQGRLILLLLFIWLWLCVCDFRLWFCNWMIKREIAFCLETQPINRYARDNNNHPEIFVSDESIMRYSIDLFLYCAWFFRKNAHQPNTSIQSPRSVQNLLAADVWFSLMLLVYIFLLISLRNQIFVHVFQLFSPISPKYV